MNSDGTQKKRITHVKNKRDSTPSWSTDGKKILFAREYKGPSEIWQFEIWIMNADGSEQKQLKSLVGGNPFFTPDGRIIFSSESKDENNGIYIVDVDGKNLQQLTNMESNEWHPKVSPDGKQIAFSSNRDGNREIYVMNVENNDIEYPVIYFTHPVQHIEILSAISENLIEDVILVGIPWQKGMRFGKEDS